MDRFLRHALPWLVAVWLPLGAFALPNRIIQEGLLFDAQGRPLQGPVDLRMRLYTLAAGGLAVYEEVHPGVALFDGWYSIELGAIAPLDPQLMAEPLLWMGVAVDGAPELQPRHALAKVPAAMMADVALDVRGTIHPSSVEIAGLGEVIDGGGRWVGDPTGLAGPQGPVGPVGPAGPAGGDGSPDTPAQVRAKLVQADGTGSGVDADLLDGLHANRFMRTDRDTGTSGSVAVGGGATVQQGVVLAGNVSALAWAAAGVPDDPASAGIRLNGRSISGLRALWVNPDANGGVRWVGTTHRIVADAQAMSLLSDKALVLQATPIRMASNTEFDAGLRVRAGTVALDNVNVQGANRIVFADPGENEGLEWAGSQARIYVAPPAGGNVDGQLRLINDTEISLEADVLASGQLTVGAGPAVSKLTVHDDSAQDTGVTISNQRAAGDTRPFIKLEGRTELGRVGWGKVQAVVGDRAGADDGQRAGGLQFVTSTGVAGDANVGMTLTHDGALGVGTEAPLAELHVASGGHTNAIIERSDTSDHMTMVVGSGGSGLRFSDDNYFFIGAQPFAQRGDGSAGTNAFHMMADGRIGLQNTAPQHTLDVNPNGAIRGVRLPSNRGAGFEHNMLFNAHRRFKVTQTGPSFGDLLFDGRFEPEYPAAAPTDAAPSEILIEGLPNIHVQNGAWIGWTTRYWGARRHTVEIFDTYAGRNVWRTVSDTRDAPRVGDDFVVRVTDAAVNKIRIRLYDGSGTGGRVGLSEVFFLHPEAVTPWEGLYRPTTVENSCFAISPASNEDLGDVINRYKNYHYCVQLNLSANTTYTWNTAASVSSHRRVLVNGGGWSNGANNITTVINMTSNRNVGGKRCVNRMNAGTFAQFTLQGVRVVNNTNDARALYESSGCRGLFQAGEGSIVTLQQTRMQVSEDVVNFPGHSYGRVRFGWTWIEKGAGSPRDIQAVKADSGWSFAGHGGVVSRSHTTLGAGVTYQDTTRITYLN